MVRHHGRHGSPHSRDTESSRKEAFGHTAGKRPRSICRDSGGWMFRRRLFPSRFCVADGVSVYSVVINSTPPPVADIPWFPASNFPAFSISAHIYMRVEKWKSGKINFPECFWKIGKLEVKPMNLTFSPQYTATSKPGKFQFSRPFWKINFPGNLENWGKTS